MATNTPNTIDPALLTAKDPASVKKLQDALVSTGYMSQAQVDTGYGTFGPKTTAAVAAYNKNLSTPDLTTAPNPFGAADAATTEQNKNLTTAGINLGTLSDSVIADTGALSSANNDIQSFIDKAIGKQNEAAAANKASVEATYSTENDYLLGKLTNQRTSLLERGGGTSDGTQALMIVDKEIEHQLDTLKKEKTAAILAGDSKAADAISQMYLKQLEYQQQNKRDHLQGVLAAAGIQKDIAGIANDIAKNSRDMTNDKLDYQIKQGTLAVAQANSISEAAYRKGSLAIQQATLDAKNGEKFKLPDSAVGILGSSLINVGKGLKDGSMTEVEAYKSLNDTKDTVFAMLKAMSIDTLDNKAKVADILGLQSDGIIQVGEYRLGQYGSEATTKYTEGVLSNPLQFDMSGYEISGTTKMFPDSVVTKDSSGNILTVFGVPVEKK